MKLDVPTLQYVAKSLSERADEERKFRKSASDDNCVDNIFVLIHDIRTRAFNATAASVREMIRTANTEPVTETKSTTEVPPSISVTENIGGRVCEPTVLFRWHQYPVGGPLILEQGYLCTATNILEELNTISWVPVPTVVTP